MTDHIDRLTGKFTLCALEHRLEVQGPPIGPGRLKCFHRCGPRFADAAVVIGDDIEAVGKQVIGEARVVSAAHRGGGVDDDDCSGRVLIRLSPGEAAKDETVGGGLLERFARSARLERQLDLTGGEGWGVLQIHWRRTFAGSCLR
ncbi:hypothetical protein D3C76_709080 [compost metagenome]